MPRGNKLEAKRGAKCGTKLGAKRVVPSRSETSSSEEEELPDLESFLVDQYKWPSFADTFGSNLFKNAASQFSEVAKFREELKEGLKPCYGNRRVPRTPKKLAHKCPPIPSNVHATIDFDQEDDDSTVNDAPKSAFAVTENGPTDTVKNDGAFISATGVVPQTPLTKMRDRSFCVSNSSNIAEAQSPFNHFRSVSPIVANTSTKNVSSRTSFILGTLPVVRPTSSTSKPTTPKESKLLEITKKLEGASIRREKCVREKQETVRQDYEQRKRRVAQNLQLMNQGQQYEHMSTPRQQALPPKRSKQPISPDYQLPVTGSIHKTTHVPKSQPPTIGQVPRLENNFMQSTQGGQLIADCDESVIIIEDDSIYCEGIVYAHSRVNEPESSHMTTTNIKALEGSSSRTFTVDKQTKPDESVYSITSEGVFEVPTKTDYGIESLWSGDDTDCERNPRKKIPSWAKKKAVRAHALNLFSSVDRNAINAYFGTPSRPDINVLFANSDKTYDMDDSTAWDSST